MHVVPRWARVEPFNPNSSHDVMRYLEHKGYDIYKNRKTKRPTADDEAIEKTQRLQLVAKGKEPDPLLDLVLEARKWQKAAGYLKDNQIGQDGKFHPIYTFRPETGRLSALRPNIQNQPNHGVEAEVAHAIRHCIVPSRPDRILMEVDWQAMEAVLTGYFANDPDYIKVSLIDSHSYFASYLLKDEGKIDRIVKPNDAGFKEYMEWIKKTFPEERFTAKRVNLATGYGMQWRHLSELLRVSAADAKRYLRLKDEMAPLVAKWKTDTWLEAHSKGYLETPFGYRNYFWNVLEPLKTQRGKFRPGREANKALAFRPQSSGAAMLRESMLSLDPLDGKLFWWLAPIHDAVLVEVEPARAQDAFIEISSVMAKAWPELSGLSIPVDAKLGNRWSDMESPNWG